MSLGRAAIGSSEGEEHVSVAASSPHITRVHLHCVLHHLPSLPTANWVGLQSPGELCVHMYMWVWSLSDEPESCFQEAWLYQEEGVYE